MYIYIYTNFRFGPFLLSPMVLYEKLLTAIAHPERKLQRNRTFWMTLGQCSRNMGLVLGSLAVLLRPTLQLFAVHPWYNFEAFKELPISFLRVPYYQSSTYKGTQKPYSSH